MNSRKLAETWPYPRFKKFVKFMRTTAANWFDEKGYPVHPSMPYCLDKHGNWKNNIILPEVAAYIESVRSASQKLKRPFPLNKYVYHGLSSQAMLFNLVGPLIVTGDLEPLRQVIYQQDIEWPRGASTASFEYEDRAVFNEDAAQPTSIDLVIRDGFGNPKVFIESKFVESEFGRCSVLDAGDCEGGNHMDDLSQCYLHFIGRTYWMRLNDDRFTPLLERETFCVFGMYYQFFRELIMALVKGGSFILLFDERSPVFYCKVGNIERGVLPFLKKFVPNDYHGRLGFITVKQLVESIKQSGRHSWITEFERKYGLTT